MQAQDLVRQRLSENRDNQDPFIDLGNCGLTQLPPQLMEFDWLEDLNLGGIYWDEAAQSFAESINDGPPNVLTAENFEVLKNLPQLRRLSARNCRVRNLQALAALTQLQSLSLGENELEDISPLQNLTRLHTLSLFDNRIRDIMPLAELTDLQVLSVNYNRVSTIAAVEHLVHLRELHLAANEIEELAPLEGLFRLERLNLSQNQVRRIRPLLGLHQLDHLRLDGNPVEDCPAEVAYSGDIQRIRAFFNTLDRTPAGRSSASPAPDTAAVPEVKLILVGNATAGKTSLSKVLRSLPFSARESTTHGIQIHEWLVPARDLEAFLPGADKPLRINIWDFGGQEYYHGTHQIFLDNNAVYLLLWDREHNRNGKAKTEVFRDGRKAELELEHFHFRYWLDSIRHYAPGASAGPRPALVLVQNKIDLEGGRMEFVDLHLLQRYGVEHVAGISLKRARSTSRRDRRYRYAWEIFREDLLRILYEKALANGQVENLPTAWVSVRRHLRGLAAGTSSDNPFSALLHEKAWMHHSDFAKACKTIQPGLTEAELSTLLYYFDRIGALVWMPRLADKVYTDPAWLTEKIYRVLSEQVQQKNGLFSTADANLGDDSAFLLSLMQTWEIIFPGKDPDTWVAPQYLPAVHEVDNLFAIALTGLQEQFFVVRAPLFLYRKILRRLIFRYGNDKAVGEKIFWQSGILLATAGEGLQSDPTNRLRVYIRGETSPDNNDGLLTICVERHKTESDAWRQRVLLDLLSVLADTRSPDWTNQAVALRSIAENQPDLCLSLNGKDFVSLPQLIDAARSGLSAIMTENRQRLRLLDFAPLLTGLQLTPPVPTIFFSYAHDDKPLRDALDRHLAPLKRLQRAVTWFDGEINAGQNWEDSIRRNLRSADVVLLLISASFIQSNFIWENELKPALERRQKGECIVIPVLLKPCDWEDLPFAALDMSPKMPDSGRLRAVSLWQDPDEALTYVVQRLKMAFLELKI